MTWRGPFYVEAATFISKSELFNGVRLAQFEHTMSFNGKRPAMTCDKIWVIATNTYEFTATWYVKFSYTEINSVSDNSVSSENTSWILKFHQIRLERSSRNIYGSFLIQGNDGNFANGTFDSISVPKEQKLSDVQCIGKGKTKITFDIYSEDERLSSMIQDYENFFENTTSCDVMFIVGGEKIPAYKNILSARSDVFAKMFKSDMKEKRTGQIEIVDIEPATFKLLLDFISCLKIDSNDLEELLELIVAADKYSIKNLVDICSYRLSCNLSVDNVVDVLIIADFVRAESLKRKCITMILDNKTEVFETKSYEKLINLHKDLVCQIFNTLMKNSSEEE